MITALPLFLNKIGAPEILLILALFLILFGGKKIPEMMRGLGRGVKEFKDAVNKDYSDPNQEEPKETSKEPESKPIESNEPVKENSERK